MEENTKYAKYLGHNVHSHSSSELGFSRLEFTSYMCLASTISLHNKLSS